MRSRDTQVWYRAPKARSVGFRAGQQVWLVATTWSPSWTTPRPVPNDTELALEVVQRGGVLVARDDGLVAAFHFRSTALEVVEALGALRRLVDGSPVAEVLRPSRALSADGEICFADIHRAKLLAVAAAQQRASGVLVPLSHARTA